MGAGHLEHSAATDSGFRKRAPMSLEPTPIQPPATDFSPNSRLRSRHRWIIIALLGVIIALLAASLVTIITVKNRVRVVRHTVTSVDTRYVNTTPPLTWGIGACVKDAGGNSSSLTSCKGAFDYVVVGETTNKDSCLLYATDGGQNYQSMWLQGPTQADYYCIVP